MPKKLNSCGHRRTGGDAIVYDNHSPPGNGGHGALASVNLFPPLKFHGLPLDDRIHLLSAQAQHRDHVVAKHLDATASDGPHRHLLVAGDSELANDEHVERFSEHFGDFCRDRHSAARQGEEG